MALMKSACETMHWDMGKPTQDRLAQRAKEIEAYYVWREKEM